MSSQGKRAVLFANGALPAPEKLLSQIEKSDLLIAVDGGLNHMIALGLTPNLIIGDLDSALPDDVRRFHENGTVVRKFPEEKDETDLELALQAALEFEPSTILVVAALGNRLDHTLGNLFLLTQPQFLNKDIRFIDGEQEVFLIDQSAEITGMPGQRVSLLPLNGPVTGIQTTGLQYPLNNETLYPDKTRGISNRMTGFSATVKFQRGILLCIHSTKTPHPRND